MPISPITLQRRQAELGRIRLGQKNADRGFPMKLSQFRFTSVSEQYIRDLADLYGGTAQPWDNNGIPSWEVLTTATSIPVIVVKGGLSQWMEFWAGGGCMHRCDGQQQVDGTPCDTEEMVKVGRKTLNPHTEAKPTTRLSVMLPELDAIGVFRMESHGWNAAAEIPAVAELAQFVGDLVPAVLHLVERRTIKDGETSRFVVPVLDLKIGAAKLREVVAAKSGIAELETPGAPSAAPAIESSPRPDYATRADEATTVDAVRDVWNEAKEAGHLDPTLKTHFTARVKELQQEAAPAVAAAEPDEEGVFEAEVVDDGADAVWFQVMSRAGELGMTTWDVDSDFHQFTGIQVSEADASAYRAYLAELQQRSAA